MGGETDLDILLKNMKPELRAGEFVFCTTKGPIKGLSPLCQFIEDEGVTLILRREEAEAAGLPYSYKARMITLHIHSSLEAVGFLAAISARLAAAGMSVNPVSAYYHDHLFIPADKAEEAMKILNQFSENHV